LVGNIKPFMVNAIRRRFSIYFPVKATLKQALSFSDRNLLMKRKDLIMLIK